MNDNSTMTSTPMSSPLRVNDDRSTWPLELRCAYDICQQSRIPMSISWGFNARLLYNKAWNALLGESPPASGSSAREIYHEQWNAVEASIAKVIDSGESKQVGRHLFGAAHDSKHDGFFNYTLQPLRLEHGDPAVLIIAERSYEDVEKYHDEFIATIAHELRNPFSALAAAAQVLNKALDRPQMMATARDALTRQVGYLAQLLDELLDVSRLRRGRVELRRRPVALKDVITAAVQASRNTLENRQHNVVVDEPAASLYINGDESLLVKMFSNLLNHVAKHTESGGLLQLQANPHDDSVDVVIRHTGFVLEVIQCAIGDGLERKFTRKPGKNLDISLYLICGLVQLHGGQIAAQGDSTGNGTDLIVSLPCIKHP